jgi:predicted DNA-binding antitoxin AbrB/MazE fold protein
MTREPTYDRVYLQKYGETFTRGRNGKWNRPQTPFEINLEGTIAEVIARLQGASTYFREGEKARITIRQERYSVVTAEIKGTREITPEILEDIENEIDAMKVKWKADGPKREKAAEKAAERRRLAAERKKLKEIEDFKKAHPELVIIPKDEVHSS